MLFSRKESPIPSIHYQDYKPHLRRDFLYRCAYCCIHEGHFGGLRNFHVDHFRPKKRFPDLEVADENLYYACSICNNSKGDAWPSPQQSESGFRFVDPCMEDPYDVHFRIVNDGSLQPLSNAGRYTSGHLRLNRPQLVTHRRRLNEFKLKYDEVRILVQSRRVPPELANRALREIEKLLKIYLDPDPDVPYEPADLLEPPEKS